MEPASDRYIREHSAPPAEALRWIERETHRRTRFPQMLSGPVQGQLLKMLVTLSGARRVLEIGAFTGYSAVCLASGLPPDGHLDTIELNEEWEDLIREGFARSGLSGKITLHIGDARELLGRLEGPFDFVFIDANKREYCDYYDLIWDKVPSGGLIVADDVLWDGKVYAHPVPQDRQTRGVVRFNDRVRSDPRVENVILPLRDGLQLIRKL